MIATMMHVKRAGQTKKERIRAILTTTCDVEGIFLVVHNEYITLFLQIYSMFVAKRLNCVLSNCMFDCVYVTVSQGGR